MAHAINFSSTEKLSLICNEILINIKYRSKFTFYNMQSTTLTDRILFVLIDETKRKKIKMSVNKYKKKKKKFTVNIITHSNVVKNKFCFVSNCHASMQLFEWFHLEYFQSATKIKIEMYFFFFMGFLTVFHLIDSILSHS